MAAWAPLLVLKKSTVPLLQEFLTTCGAVSPVDETAKVLAWLPSVVPVYAVNVRCAPVGLSPLRCDFRQTVKHGEMRMSWTHGSSRVTKDRARATRGVVASQPLLRR